MSLLIDYVLSKDRRPLGWLDFCFHGDGLASRFKNTTFRQHPCCSTNEIFAIAVWDRVRLVTYHFFSDVS
jgi:hypothetical protein